MKEQNIKNKIYEQFLTSLKSDYEQELNSLKQGNPMLDNNMADRSRSASPF